MDKPIEAKVAQILSDRIVVINAGARAGVTVGMRFAVLMEGDEVKDPVTGEVLGRWEAPKGFLIATHVQERLTTCESAAAPRASTEEGEQILSAAMIAASMRPDAWGGAPAPLEVNRSQVSGMPRLSPISIGDTVRQVILPAASKTA